MHLSDLMITNSGAQYESDIKQLQSSKLPTVIFGAARAGKIACNWLTSQSIEVVAFCESAAFWRKGKTFFDKPVYNFETLSEQFDKCNLVFAAIGRGIRKY